MARFCEQCGKELSDTAKFCAGCGLPVMSAGQDNQAPISNGVQIGFSNRINDPLLAAKVKKQKTGAFVFGLILVPAPLIITFVIGIMKDDFTYLKIGFFVSLVFLVCNVISTVTKKCKKQWDGVVTRKYTQEVREHNKEDGEKNYYTYTQYILEVQKDNGTMTKIKEGNKGVSTHMYYDYLNVGDRIRYYPQFTYFYEKYDKTHDTHVNCPICGKFNPLASDVCEQCGTPVFK